MGYPTYVDEGPTLVLVPEFSSTSTVEWPTHLAGDLGILLISSKIYPTGAGDSINQTVIDESWEFAGFGQAALPSPPAISQRIDIYYRIATSGSEPAVSVTIPSTEGDSVNITMAVICTVRGYNTDVIIDGISWNSNGSSNQVQLNAPETTLSPNCLLLYCVQIRYGTDPYNSDAFPLSHDENQDNAVFRFQTVSTIEDSGDSGTTLLVGTSEEIASSSEHFLELHPLLGTPSPDPYPDLAGFPWSFWTTVAIAGTLDVPPEPHPLFPYEPIQDGYTNEFGQDVIEIPLSGGPSRKHLDIYFAGHIVNVSWLLTREEYTEFMGYFRTTLAYGSEPFLIDLITDIGVPTTHLARTLGGLPKLTRQSGDAYYVTCTLQCERNPTFTGNIIYQEDGDVIFATDNPPLTERIQVGDTIRIIDSAGIHPTGNTPLNLDGVYTVANTTGFNVITLDDPASVNSDWAVLAALGTDMQYGDVDNGDVISTLTRVPQ